MNDKKDVTKDCFSVRRLELRNFRNFQCLNLEVPSGFTIVAGQNAQGKTNLLEAVYALSTTRLLRSSRDADAIMNGCDSAGITAEVGPYSTSVELKFERGLRKKALLNGMPCPRASDIIGRVPSVVISSLDLAIARGEPADRRLFLDMTLSQTSPSYLEAFTNYRRALEHRNSLLKAAFLREVRVEELEVWEDVLAASGSAIRRQRRDFLEALDLRGKEAHSFLGGGEQLAVEYESKDDAESPEGLLSAYQSGRAIEIQRGTTQIGPHRDDIKLDVGGLDLRYFGSQGQQRTAVISLKLATLLTSADRLGMFPVLLLDDMLSDLDEGRRKRLVEWILGNAQQAILTCTEASAAGPDLLQRAAVYTVSAGKLDRSS